MIASLGEIKAILGYSDTTNDARIMALLPMVEAEVLEYCNNTFLHSSIYFSGDIVCSVTAGPVYSFTCSDGGMDDAEIAADDIIYLSGSNRNDGYYTVLSVADGAIVVKEKLIAQASAELTLYLVDFPEALKIYVAKMIAFQLDHATDAGITSESIGNYSYSRAATIASEYPVDIMRGLDKWKRIKVGYSSITIQMRERRGLAIDLQETESHL